MIQIQDALNYKPGKFGAIVLFERKTVGDASVNKLLRPIASMMKCFEEDRHRPANLHILTAINPHLIGESKKLQVLPLPNKQLFRTQQMPSTQQDVIVQVSAMTHTDRLYALRVIHSILGEDYNLTSEIMGGSLNFGQDVFGFYSDHSVDQNELNKVSRINDGKLEGGSWLLYQLYQQNLSAFFDMSGKDQTNVMGGESVVHPDNSTGSIPKSAHTKVAKDPSRQPVMNRRGISFRKDGIEGTAFLATSSSVEVFKKTLDRMLGTDKMLDFATAIEGGVYFVPPTGNWLDDSAPTPKLPSSAQHLPMHVDGYQTAHPASLQDYTVAEDFLHYLDAVREKDFFIGPIGNLDIHPDVKTLLHAINDVMAGAELSTPPVTSGGNAMQAQQLNQLIDDTLKVANTYNGKAKKYMTVG